MLLLFSQASSSGHIPEVSVLCAFIEYRSFPCSPQPGHGEEEQTGGPCSLLAGHIAAQPHRPVLVGHIRKTGHLKLIVRDLHWAHPVSFFCLPACLPTSLSPFFLFFLLPFLSSFQLTEGLGYDWHCPGCCRCPEKRGVRIHLKVPSALLPYTLLTTLHFPCNLLSGNA